MIKNIGLAILILLTLVCLFNSKIRIGKIVAGHFESFKNDRTGKVSPFDYITFIVLPIAISAYATLALNILLDDVNVLLTVFSIFTALLFNFLMLVIQMKDKPKEELKKINVNIDIEKYFKCIDQTYYNVSFAILLSILAILLLWVISIVPSEKMLAIKIMSVITETVIIMFFMDLIMILKRIFAIYNIDNNK